MKGVYTQLRLNGEPRGVFQDFLLSGSNRLVPAIRPNNKNLSKKWESCLSISPEAVARTRVKSFEAVGQTGMPFFMDVRP